MIYWIVFFWVSFFGLFYRKKNSTRIKCPDGTYEYHMNAWYCVLIFAVPFLVATFRVMFNDTGTYINLLNEIPPSFAQFSAYVRSRDSSQLFYGIEMILKLLGVDKSWEWFGIIAFVQSWLLLHMLRKYSPDMGMSVFLFVASSMYFSWMTNGVRQYTAVVILFAASDLLVKKKWFPYCLLVLFIMGLGPVFSVLGIEEVPTWQLGGIHESAMIMIPICFCLIGKEYNWRIWVIAAMLVVLVATGGLSSLMETAVEDTSYSRDLQYVMKDDGTNIFRVLVCAVPSFMALVARKELKKNPPPPFIRVCINASFITTILYVASAFTSGIYVGRLPVYTELYNLILLPWLVTHPFRKNRDIFRLLIVGCYFAFFFYQAFLTWGNSGFVVEIFGKRFT